MFRALTAFGFAVISLLVNSAHAAYDPCYAQYQQMNSAERMLANSQRMLDNTQNQFANAQNQVDIRLMNMRFQVDQAQANVNFAGATTGGMAAGCAIRSIFYRGVGCWGGVATSSIIRRANAQRYYNLAVMRYNSYVNYASGYLARMAQRVVLAQQQYNQAKLNYDTAVASYQQCLASNSASSNSSVA